jgi:hypothetical protein
MKVTDTTRSLPRKVPSLIIESPIALAWIGCTQGSLIPLILPLYTVYLRFWTRCCEIFQLILDRFGCCDSKQNLQCPVNCLGWTPASIPLLTNATITDGKIDSLPDPSIAYRSLIATEVRDVAIGPLINNFPRNSEGTDQLRLNTCDPDNNNRRKARLQFKMQPLHVVSMSTNCTANGDKIAEEFTTLGAVVAVIYFLCILVST